MRDMPQGKRTVSDDEILNEIRNHRDPFVAAVEIADVFNHTRQWAYQRLEDLKTSDKISKKKAGSNSVIYWVPD